MVDSVSTAAAATDLGDSGMSMSPKTITVFLDASPTGQKRAAHAASLAQRWGAHLVGVHVVYAGVSLPPYMANARGKGAYNQVIDYERQLDSNAEAVARQVGAHFTALCAELKVSGEFRAIGRENSVAEAIGIAFHCDLVIVGHPEPHGLPDGLSLEKLLLVSGAPLLIVPNAWKGETIGTRILIGWNATRQARRAVADSMAFLIAAQSVTVLTIDSRERRLFGEGGDGADIAAHLDRHGAHVVLEQIPSHGFSIPAILLGYSEQCSSDLLVIGAYSHARLRELLFGGTTRTLLAQTPMPTLISR